MSFLARLFKDNWFFSTFFLLTMAAQVVFCLSVAEAAEKFAKKPSPVLSAKTELISVIELLQQQAIGKSDFVIVDVRLADSYDLFRIPGSINISLPFVKTKKFLTGRKVVLVNEGFVRKSLEAEMSRLKAKGFEDVKILAGGIRGWLKNGGQLEGDKFAAANVKMVSPSELMKDLGRKDLLVIALSGKGFSEGQGEQFGSVHIPYDPKKPEEFLAELNSKAFSRISQTDLLFVSRSGEHYQGIDELLSKSRNNTFFLDGGFAAYQDFLDTRQDMTKQATRSTGNVTCPICPK